MGVRVFVDRAALGEKLKRDRKRVEAAVAEQVLSDCTPIVPLATGGQSGTLRASGRVEEIDGKQAVTWNTPYAAYQYYGCWPDGTHQIHDHTTAGTDIQWCEKAKRQHREEWQKVAQNALEGG